MNFRIRRTKRSTTFFLNIQKQCKFMQASVKKLLQISWYKKKRTPSSITNLFSSCQSKVRYWVGPRAWGDSNETASLVVITGTLASPRYHSLLNTGRSHSGTGKSVDVTPADNYVPIFHTVTAHGGVSTLY